MEGALRRWASKVEKKIPKARGLARLVTNQENAGRKFAAMEDTLNGTAIGWSVMPRKRQTLRGEITYSEAKDKEINILPKLSYWDKRNQLYVQLLDRSEWIKAVVAHHLGLKSPDDCSIADTEDWFRGSFNVCIPVKVERWSRRNQPGHRVLLRLPLPFRVGEAFRPGNGDEKLRCEAGTYAWLQENCPDVPIPKLYGFALSGSQTFTHMSNLPLGARWYQILSRQVRSWLGLTLPTKYIPHPVKKSIAEQRLPEAGYLLIEYVEQNRGRMLSETWSERNDDPKLRANFFRDLSRIMLSVSKVPLQRIGSFVIDSRGYLQLANRPLTLELQDLENEEIPTDIARDYTYSSVDLYAQDIMRFHDNRIRYQPNAVNNIGDFAHQVSALTGMRAAMSMYLKREFRHGPFVFCLTDLHASNIFVDEDWNITSLVDLEWACSRPVEFIAPPYWLTNQGVDLMLEDEYDERRMEFMNIFSAEEERFPQQVPLADPAGNSLSLSEVMNDCWERRTFWYTLALSSPTGLFSIFFKHIQPPLITHSPDHVDDFLHIMVPYWSRNFAGIMHQKVADKEQYDRELEEAFADETDEADEPTGSGRISSLAKET